MLSGIKLVTFDVTNTLLKFHIPPWEYYALVARKYGYVGKPNDLKSKLLNSYKTMAQQHPNFGKETIYWQYWWSRVVELTFHGQLPGKTDISMLSKQLIEDYKTSMCWQKAEGCNEILDLLRYNGITLGVISNFDPRLYEILLNLNINKCFEFIVTSYEVGISKPDKRIFKIAQERSKQEIGSSECLHIGDDLKNDYEGAKEAGWNALLVTNQINLQENKIIKHVYPNLKVLCYSIKNNELNIP